MELKVLFILAFVAVAQCTELIPLSCRQIRAFVDGHNSRRHLAAKGRIDGQPPASEMKMMVWDEELQAKASKWAKENLNYHNPDKSVGSNRFRTGENLYWYSTTDPYYVIEPKSSLEAWFSENVNFTFGPMQVSDFELDYEIGHYTQMVWSDSVYLGCAISQTFKDEWNNFFVVCNYGPAGNIIGTQPYDDSNGRSNKLICGSKNCNRRYGPKCRNIDFRRWFDCVDGICF